MKKRKRAFTICVEDGCDIVGLQLGVAVQRESDGEKGVTFFHLSEDFKDGDEWLFKVSGKAERIEKRRGAKRNAESIRSK